MAETAEAAEAAAPAARTVRPPGNLVATVLQGLGLTVVIAIGTLAGQLLYRLVGGHEDPHATEAAPSADVEMKADARAEQAQPKAPPLYHAFEPLIVNFEEEGQLHFLQVTVEIMAREEKTIAAVQSNTPVLRNDLLLLIGSRDMKQLLTREGKEQLRALALEEIQKTMSKLSPGSRVEDVYFTAFVMQ